MIKKHVYGTPFETEAAVLAVAASSDPFSVGESVAKGSYQFTYEMADTDLIFGLGENTRGINKRGYLYTSYCIDEKDHTEDKHSMYSAHNFILISGASHVGLFFDYPSRLTFDIGYTTQNLLTVSCASTDLYVYEITGDSDEDVVKQFRHLIGRSYIPPKFAFGFGQSRWGYKTADDFRNVVKTYRKNHLPIDMLYMDIDYMDHFKDFTVSPEEFPDFASYVDEMKAQNIHLVPIIDAGVKVEDGYDVYEEGKDKNYFCKRADGSDFAVAVWPGWTHFPDFLNPDARKWFGHKYDFLLSKGIDAFWNDMNEPATFYTEEGLAELRPRLQAILDGDLGDNPSRLSATTAVLSHNPKDFSRFYHNIDGKMVCNETVHNLFGYNMTRSAGEAFTELVPDKRILIFSRSSYIGMHRYGGTWMGDNKSWWSHILLNLKMLPSLNMCGILYTGADLGGFMCNTTRDLVLRWLALGVFTPLMRNHTALGTREQECYQFEHIEDFRHVLGVRYRLVPYLYSEYMKAALNDEMLFRPLSFVYPEDTHAREVEDQLMLGHEIMIAPVYTQNTTGRYVYLPEEMKFIKFLPDGRLYEEILPQGHHYVGVALNEVPLFIRKDKCIPVCDVAESVPEIDYTTIQMVGYPDAKYDLYDDDGATPIR